MLQTLMREIYTPRKNIKNTLVVLSEWQGSGKCFYILNIFEFSKFLVSDTIRKQLKKKTRLYFRNSLIFVLLFKKTRLLTWVRTLYFPDTSFSPNTDAYGVSQITIKHSVKQPQHSQKCVCVCVCTNTF